MKYLDLFMVFESAHDTGISEICRHIIYTMKETLRDGDEDTVISLPSDYNGDVSYVCKYRGYKHEFVVEVYIHQDESIESYIIDADAPSDRSENDVVVVIYINPNMYPKNIEKIHFNLLYTLRHEYEHLLQVYTDYQNVIQSEDHINFKDGLQYLMKPQEIEPQIRGYYLRAKKERKAFSQVIMTDLDKYERTGQIEFESDRSKQILLDKLVSIALDLGLKIK